MANEIISKNYSVENIYEGIDCYHSLRDRANEPKKGYSYRIGVELECEFSDSDDRDAFVDIPRNWYYCERDGSLNSNGCEVITIPLLPADAMSPDFWKPLTDELKDFGAVSWDSPRCGLHVHIGRELFGNNAEEQSKTIGKLLYLYHEVVKDTPLNKVIYGRSHGYNEHNGSTDYSKAVKLIGSKLLRDKEIAKKVDESMKERANTTRYFDINLQPTLTVEFRKGRGSLNPERIASVVEYCVCLVKFAKRSPWSGISLTRFHDFLMLNAKNTMLKQFLDDVGYQS